MLFLTKFCGHRLHMFEAPQLCLLCACWGREKTEWLVFFLLNSGSDLWHPLNRRENHLLSHLWHLVYTLLKSRCRTQSIFDFSQKHHSHKALMHIVEFTGKKNGHAGYVCSCYTSILKTKKKKSLQVLLFLKTSRWKLCELSLEVPPKLLSFFSSLFCNPTSNSCLFYIWNKLSFFCFIFFSQFYSSEIIIFSIFGF